MERRGASSMTRLGAELDIGTTAFQINDAARTDTHAAEGEIWIYRSGATLVLQLFDAQAAAWRAVSLT